MMKIKLFRTTPNLGVRPEHDEKLEVWQKYKSIVHEVGEYTNGISPEDLYEFAAELPEKPLGKLSAHEFFIGMAKLLEAGFLRVEVGED